MDRSQWPTLPHVLGINFILVQSRDFSSYRQQQAEDATGFRLRAVYFLCVSISAANYLTVMVCVFQNCFYVLRNLGCRDKDLWLILSVETRPLFLLHFCIFNEIRPVLDAMAIDTSIFSNKPFVRGILQMFFKCEYTFFVFIFCFLSFLPWDITQCYF